MHVLERYLLSKYQFQQDYKGITQAVGRAWEKNAHSCRRVAHRSPRDLQLFCSHRNPVRLTDLSSVSGKETGVWETSVPCPRSYINSNSKRWGNCLNQAQLPNLGSFSCIQQRCCPSWEEHTEARRLLTCTQLLRITSLRPGTWAPPTCFCIVWIPEG